MSATLNNYNPENKVFWDSEGKKIANRNLWISIPNLILGFVVWYIFSVVIINLNKVGFTLTDSQIFNLISLPGLFGATLRLFYGFFIPICGGRNFTVISTLSLLIPAIGIGTVSQNPDTPYWVLSILAMVSGFGCANFSSSMANIPAFYPKAQQGSALGLNGGLGNLGVSVVQFATPLLIATGMFVWIFGEGQVTSAGDVLYLQNAGYFWVIPILFFAVLAFFGMNNLKTKEKISVKDQLCFFSNKNTYFITVLYTMTFGSFAGFAIAFPAVLNMKYPEVNASSIIFIGPLVGALARSLGGILADKYHKGWINIIVFLALAGVLFLATLVSSAVAFIGVFIILFALAGIGNGTVFALNADCFGAKEKGAAVGFVAAIGAYGAFLVPQIFKYSLAFTHDVNAGLWIIFAFNFLCLLITYFCYVKKSR